jgi:hypothetical protein
MRKSAWKDRTLQPNPLHVVLRQPLLGTPTTIRHLHDLAALRQTVAASGMLEKLTDDKLWTGEYEDYVDAVSFARLAERIGFDAALAAVRDGLNALVRKAANDSDPERRLMQREALPLALRDIWTRKWSVL